MQEPSVKLILDTRYESSSGYPIKLRVTFVDHKKSGKKWIQKYYPTGYFAADHEEFKTIMETPRSVRHRDIQPKIKAKELNAASKISKYKISTVEDFELHYLSSGSVEEVRHLFDVKIATLEAQGKFSTAEKYRSAISVIEQYFGKGVTYGEITPDRLEAFKVWYMSPRMITIKSGKTKKIAGRSQAAMAFHLRALRHICKTAIKKHVINPDQYPFTDLQIPAVRRAMKRFLSDEETTLLLNSSPPEPSLRRYLAFWTFSYLCNGLNFADILRMKRRAIKPEYIEFYRHKTINSDQVKEHVIIPLTSSILAIISEYGNPALDPDVYVFPILNDDLTEKQKFRKIRTFVKRTNDAISIIGRRVGIQERITTYTARHTFSNQIINNDESTETLQVLLGHKQKKTTEIYKHGLSLDKLRKATEKIIVPRATKEK